MTISDAKIEELRKNVSDARSPQSMYRTVCMTTDLCEALLDEVVRLRAENAELRKAIPSRRGFHEVDYSDDPTPHTEDAK